MLLFAPDGDLRNYDQASLNFRKLDENLQQRVRRSPLIPFEGEHTLFYLELRELIQEVTERARDGETKRTFIPTDLRQGLSSYRQIAASDLLNRDLESAACLRGLVERWNKDGKLHPKVAALGEVVRGIVEAEIRKVRETPGAWFSKILIFNKLIRGTAPQLTEVLGGILQVAFDRSLSEFLAPMGMSREDLGKKVRQAVDAQLDGAERLLKKDPACAAWRHVPDEFAHDDFVRHRGRSILHVFRDQWFQILIGSKKNELGLLPEEVDQEVAQDQIEDDGSGGALTDDEKARVMLDLRPE